MNFPIPAKLSSSVRICQANIIKNNINSAPRSAHLSDPETFEE